MRKLHLKIDALAVESFDTASAEKGRGTVQAHAVFTHRCQPSMPCALSDDDPTCIISCGYVGICPVIE